MQEPEDRRWLYGSIVLLAVYLALRLINLSSIIKFFPLGRVDISNYMAILHFLAEQGYGAIAPQWYNGFDLFLTFQPGWYLFSLPFYWLAGKVETAAYLSIIAMLLASFYCIIKIAKLNGLSKAKACLLSLLVLANPVSIAEFLKLGRTTELFGFMIFFAIALLVFYYKDKQLDLKFAILFSLLNAISILSHFSEALLAGVLVLGLFLIKDWKEKSFIFISGFASLILSSFWLVPFVKAVSQTTITGYHAALRLLDFQRWFFDSSLSLLVSSVLLVLFYFYLRELKQEKVRCKREALFYLPVIVLAFLILSRAVIFIPLLKDIFPDSYLIFLIFFSSLIFLKIDISKLELSNLFYPLLFLVVLAGIILSAGFTPWFTAHNQENSDTLELMKSIPQDAKFLVLNGEESTSIKYYDYAAIYLNLSTAAGDYEEVIEGTYIETIRNTNRALNAGNCKEIKSNAAILKVTHLITHNDYCLILSDCNLGEIKKIGSSCLYIS